MITIGTALIIASVCLNIYMGLYIFCPKVKEYIDNIIEEEC